MRPVDLFIDSRSSTTVFITSMKEVCEYSRSSRQYRVAYSRFSSLIRMGIEDASDRSKKHKLELDRINPP